jgi:hypothetical protein
MKFLPLRLKIPLRGGVPLAAGRVPFSNTRNFRYRGILGTTLSPPSMGKTKQFPSVEGCRLRRGGCLSQFLKAWTSPDKVEALRSNKTSSPFKLFWTQIS